MLFTQGTDYCGFIAVSIGKEMCSMVLENWFVVSEIGKSQGIFIISISGPEFERHKTRRHMAQRLGMGDGWGT